MKGPIGYLRSRMTDNALRFLLITGILLVFTFVSVTFLSGTANAQLGESKISGEILAHQKEKAKPADVRAETHRRNLIKYGLNPNNINAEDCALYVEDRLTDAEINELAEKGIIVNLDCWVPAVPGKHPYGFYLATVDYSSLDIIENDSRFTRLESTEFANYPLNNTGGALINVDDVHSGTGVTARDGTGVKIAVADSGVDLTHADLPTPVEAYDMTDGTNTATWGADVSNTVSDHGTHVSGTVLGDGTLSAGNTGNGGGPYVGGAPGASFYFYKIGNDITAGASDTDEVEAITRAGVVGCDIFTMSYGGISTYMDGSSAMSQAIDSAVSSGMVVFVSAGNEALDAIHDSMSIAPGATSPTFSYSITNPSGSTAYTVDQWIRVIWIDDNSSDRQMTLTCTNLGGGESLTQMFSATSTRGTEAKRYTLTPNIAVSGSKTYNFTITNGAGSGTTPLVHVYRSTGIGTFDSPDSSYTVSNPALADSAIAVAAYVHRSNWTDADGGGWSFGETLNTRASFSSIGPRIDGTMKPDIASPGSVTISLRDSNILLSPDGAFAIDNDGTTGAGPANYYAMQGTSMACPMAAGATALLLEAYPSLTPANVYSLLTSTASQSSTPDNNLGYGLMDILAAVLETSVDDWMLH